MKKLLFGLLAITILFSSCADNKEINGITYRPYGLLNESTCKNDSIQYEIDGWAVVSGLVFFELIVPPIYVFGYNVYEPVGLKSAYKNEAIKGVVE